MEETGTVAVIDKDDLLCIAAGEDVEECTGVLESKRSRHSATEATSVTLKFGEVLP
jgi:hypothetical protein